MFELSRDEIMRISQTVTSSQIKYSKRVHAFTEQGVAMLSSVLNSERAIEVNIAIMRAFVKLREMLGAHKDLGRKLAALEKKYDKQFKIVFEAIAELMTLLRALAADIRRRTQTVLSSRCVWTRLSVHLAG